MGPSYFDDEEEQQRREQEFLMQQAGNTSFLGEIPSQDPNDVDARSQGIPDISDSTPEDWPNPQRQPALSEEMEDVAPVRPSALEGAPTLNSSALRASQERLARMMGQHPVAKNPGILQRIAAGALGGMAGWSNAAGRARPIDASEATENILRPGYKGQVEAWQHQVQGAKADTEMQQAEYDRIAAQRKAAMGEDTAQITAELKRAQAKSVKARSELDAQDVWAVAPDGTLYNKRTAERSGTPNTTRKYNLQKVTVQVPGESEPQEAFIDPRNPGTIWSLNGEELPPGTKSVSVPFLSAQMRMDAWGEMGKYVQAGIGQGLTRGEARARAGQMVDRKYGVGVANTLQAMELKGELSGLGMPNVSGPPVPGTPTTPQAGPAQPKPGGQGTTQQRPRFPLQFTDRESGQINQFLGNIMGVAPTGGIASQVGIKKGRELLAARAGVDPMTLTADFVQNKNIAKQLGFTMERSGAIQRLNNTIDAHGKLLVSAAEKLKDTGSPLFNGPVRDWKRKAAGSEELKAFQIAINAMQREYSYLTAGAMSRAMLPVTTMENMQHLISEDVTFPEVISIVNQIKREAHAETQAMIKTQNDMINDLKSGVAGRAARGQGGDQPPPGGGAVPTVTSKTDFDKLPSGMEYIGKDGRKYRKP